MGVMMALTLSIAVRVILDGPLGLSLLSFQAPQASGHMCGKRKMGIFCVGTFETGWMVAFLQMSLHAGPSKPLWAV